MAEPNTINEPIAENGRMTPLGEKTFMGGLRVATRVRLFIFLTVLAIAGTGGIFYYADKQLNLANDQLTDSASIAQRAAEIEKHIWQLRNIEQEFSLSRDSKHIGVYQSVVKTLNSLLASLESIKATKAVKEHIATVSDGIAQHAKAFERLHKNNDKELTARANKLVQALNVSAKALEEHLTKVTIASLSDSLAHARQTEARFKASGATAELQKHAKQLNEFNRLLVSAPISKKDRGIFKGLIKTYQNNMTAFAKVRLSLLSQEARLDEIFTYLLPSLNGITEFAKRHHASIQDETSVSRQKIRMIIAAGVASILIVLMLFGIILMQSLTKPMRVMAQTAEKLVKGDQDLQLPALGNYDEIGEVARALNILKETLIETTQLQQQLLTARTNLNQSERNLQAEQSKTKQAEDELSVAQAAAQASAERAQKAEQSQQTLMNELAAEKERAKKVEQQRQAEPPPRQAESSVPALPDEPIESITALSDQLAQSSQTASAAAFEAERTSALIRGLNEAEAQLEKIEPLVRLIGKETNLPAAGQNKSDTHQNLVALTTGSDELPNADIRKRFETIRKAAIQVLQTVRLVNRTMADSKGAALEIAAASSAGALEITSDLLAQSENLRGMLNNLIGKLHSTSPPDTKEIAAPKPTVKARPTPVAKPTAKPKPTPRTKRARPKVAPRQKPQK